MADIVRLKMLADSGDHAARLALIRECLRRDTAEHLTLDWLRGDALPAMELGALYPEGAFPEDLHGIPSDLATVLWRLTEGEKTLLRPARTVLRDQNVVRVTCRRQTPGGFRLSIQHKKTMMGSHELQRCAVQLGVWPPGTKKQICKGFTFKPNKNHKWWTTARWAVRCWRDLMGLDVSGESAAIATDLEAALSDAIESPSPVTIVRNGSTVTITANP